jgi:hypothetical protein
MSKHRKVWIAHNGPIPKDSDGRAMEIHHIDGNHSNNSIHNLKLVTLQEHYDIHYSQGDYGACYYMMIERMNKTPEDISKMASLHQRTRVKNRTHNLLGSAMTNKRKANGTHNFIGSSNPVYARIASGQLSKDTTKDNYRRLAEGTHPSQIKLSCLECRQILSVTGLKKHIKYKH